MLRVRRGNERGYFDHGWLKTYHTFSFGGYYDPERMGYRSLRVINEDWVEPGAGFGTHGHRDMEIVTYVLEGSLEHRDSLGSGSVLRPTEVQRMSAGTGIRHSEFNASATERVHLLQIWIEPERAGLTPEYEELSIAREEKLGRLRLIASRDGRDNSLKIHQDADIYATILDSGNVELRLREGRGIWVQVARGDLRINGERLSAGDGVVVEQAERVVLEGTGEALLFDLA